MKNLLLLLLVLTVAMSDGHAQPLRQQPEPPAFDTDTPRVHDPVMAYEDGVYYAFYTGENIGFMTSDDRRTWTVRRDGLLRGIPEWTHDSVPGFRQHIWAPDIIRWNGRWWMAYSCSTFGKNTSAIGLLSASSLAQADWQDEGCIVASRELRDNWNAIDPNFVEDENGRLWLTWGSFWDGIQMAPLAMRRTQSGRETLRLCAYPRTIARRHYQNSPQNLQNPTSRHAGTNAIEAPFVMKHQDYYYLFVSWDYCCRGLKSTYRVVVGRSKKVSGPYLDKAGIPMYAGGGTPVIEGDKKEFEAIGHNAAYPFPDGDLYISHGYDVALNGQPVLVQKKIRWTDGWPVLE